MWTAAALATEARPYAAVLRRIVEGQWKAATLRITDNLEEQRILEEIIEETKPPIPAECEGLHYLLLTPFRYGSYDGSRFRPPGPGDGVLYASERVETAIAEHAFLQLLFYSEAAGLEPPPTAIERTAITVGCRTNLSIDLTRPPLDKNEDTWSAPADYGPCQALAETARRAELECIVYKSVRDPDGGRNAAILTPAAFTGDDPLADMQTWHLLVRRQGVHVWCENPKIEIEYPIEVFTNDPRINV